MQFNLHIFYLLQRKERSLKRHFLQKKPNLYQIKKIHKKYLKRFEKPILIKQEEGILPMGAAKPKNYKNILKIGMSAGMIRPSSGYSMMRVAGWISKVGDLELNEQTISRFIYNPSRVLNWMDKLFLKVCFNRPDMGPTLFMSLFSKAETGTVIRFMAESNTYLDLLKVVMSLPKKIMIMSLFK
ncbi:lycopene cyclase family protein [Methylophilaceae bacterium]|nr:lycopene cyclase family protein [Methylophilaceae bacterium]